MYALLIILVVVIALVLCLRKDEGYWRGPYFPKKGTCTQKCRNYCTPPVWKGQNPCNLVCLTEVDGRTTSACKKLRNSPGDVPPYPCHFSWGGHGELRHQCMAKSN